MMICEVVTRSIIGRNFLKKASTADDLF